MARPVWSGTISFGLVNVPVKAFTAVRDHDVHFHQLDKKSGSRIRYKKVTEKSGREVDADQIEMGFEIADGRYVTFDKKELDELRPKSTQDDRGHRLRRPRRRRPDLLRAHVLAGPGRRRRRTRLPTAAGGDGGTRPSRHRHGGDAQQAVPHGDPPARRSAGDVDDAVRRRGRTPSRDRRTPVAPRQAGAEGAEDGPAAARLVGRRLGSEAVQGHLRRGAARPHRGQGGRQGDRGRGADRAARPT